MALRRGYSPAVRPRAVAASRGPHLAQMDLIDHLENQIQILMLAAHDMDEVIAACAALEGEEAPGPLSQALATAIAVCYARPFSAANTIGRLGGRWTPRLGTPERELHDWLLEERKTRYAHTDREAKRLVLHRHDPQAGPDELAFDALAVVSLPFPRERLGPIKDLAKSLRERLSAEAFDLQEKLLAEVRVPTRPNEPLSAAPVSGPASRSPRAWMSSRRGSSETGRRAASP
jgi:hypothetical protein